MTPIKTSNAIKMLNRVSFSLKKYGSIKVTKRGKLEKVTSPTATEDSCMARKNVVQWQASKIPWRIKKNKDVLSRLPSFVRENIFAYTNKVTAAKKVRPNTMINGLQDKNLPKSPANPNKNTARWILII